MTDTETVYDRLVRAEELFKDVPPYVKVIIDEVPTTCITPRQVGLFTWVESTQVSGVFRVRYVFKKKQYGITCSGLSCLYDEHAKFYKNLALKQLGVTT